jgi:hypothetical protein
MARWLGRLAFADWVATGAVDVRSFFHGFTLGAAVLAGSGLARTHGVSAFMRCFRGHLFLLSRIFTD